MQSASRSSHFDQIYNFLKYFFCIENSVLPPLPDPFVLPDKLTKPNKKVVYVSVGSLSSSYLPLMEHIVEVLSQLPNYGFILSAGPHIDQLKFGENTYAERYLNQLAVLQSVSCFVSHGGEWVNTLSRVFGYEFNRSYIT